MRTFFIADHHFGHSNILRYERAQFKDIKEHDEFIIAEHNKIVRDNDTVYFLGDIGISDYEYLKGIISRLKGNKILILGNHDHLSQKMYVEMGFKLVVRGPVYWDGGFGKIILSHEPVKEAENNPFVINIHGHLHGMRLKLSNYFCVSAGNINYEPQNAKKFAKYYDVCKKRKEEFLREWYSKYCEVFGYRDDIVLNLDNTINVSESIIKCSKAIR